MKFSPSSSFAG